MKPMIRTTASLLAAATALAVTAQSAAQDRDGVFADGVLTRAEAIARQADRFAAIDANADGYISSLEVDAAKERRKADREARRAERAERSERAGGKRGKDGLDRIERLDTDKDGFISRAEAERAALDRFEKLDQDGDGAVTRDEMRDAKRAGRGGDRSRRGR